MNCGSTFFICFSSLLGAFKHKTMSIYGFHMGLDLLKLKTNNSPDPLLFPLP